MDKPTTYWTQEIMKICKVDLREANLVEAVMRNTAPTFGNLNRKEFTTMAREAQRLLKNPEIRCLYE